MIETVRGKVACRAIEERDLAGVVDCLTRGFPERTRDYWTRGISVLAARRPVGDYERYGYLLEAKGRVVGVLLQIFSTRDTPDGPQPRCNGSSWCVDPEYRGYSNSPLHVNATRRREVTYTNISPALHTLPIIEKIGYRRYTEGQVIFAPLLSHPDAGARVVEYAAERSEAALLLAGDARLLADHAALGCYAFIGLVDGEARPLVFQPRTIWRGRLAGVHVIYCREASDLARFSRGYGIHLARRGRFFAVVDTVGPIPGLAGRNFAGRELRYFRGPHAPVAHDLAYTELVVFGR